MIVFDLSQSTKNNNNNINIKKKYEIHRATHIKIEIYAFCPNRETKKQNIYKKMCIKYFLICAREPQENQFFFLIAIQPRIKYNLTSSMAKRRK